MKTVPLHQVHIDLGAKMVPFAGFEMPVRYSSDLDEHHTVRNNVGVFDVSHMGEFSIKGPKALDLIQKVTSNDASALFDGKVQYSYLPNGRGGVVDDLLVYRLKEDEYFLVVNASNIDKDWNWIQSHNTEGVAMENLSDDLCLFAVQGPNATPTLQKLTSVDLDAMDYYTFKISEMAGISDVIISATGYTGAGGFEIYVKNADAVKMWEAIFAAGAEFGIKPVGLGARDTLRLEKGFCLYGNDIDDSTSPLEAGLGWVTKFTKDFIDAEELKAQKEAGLEKKLVGFEMIDRGIPRGHYELCDAAGAKLGKVTSGTQSPTLQKGIGMGYVPTSFAKPETEIFVKVRDRLLKAKVVKLPFVKN
ncbi:glycine cleavage system aminomethyltransferase GcvT [Dyadobacter chenwenxiniae]|uniref:Aminomethyltransferase n=1 Tax=Dyadobacter chenwenxiniae TaxID=2906456 RepID=A0A9X1PI10_9BACT|nr:glycine cleavage system aminomethyltransferase GcvT [Dyadobacter chenwenxiniae]MCF0061410.1 glycine cleavage system aminomethyltransferase GcvT [Dyadobacter chenwenxiniae]UON81231.1 glycine cleavage system aminomethyltransferase GcvT [Dyadobacter chenwenxiniae]